MESKRSKFSCYIKLLFKFHHFLVKYGLQKFMILLNFQDGVSDPGRDWPGMNSMQMGRLKCQGSVKVEISRKDLLVWLLEPKRWGARNHHFDDFYTENIENDDFAAGHNFACRNQTSANFLEISTVTDLWHFSLPICIDFMPGQSRPGSKTPYWKLSKFMIFWSSFWTRKWWNFKSDFI